MTPAAGARHKTTNLNWYSISDRTERSPARSSAPRPSTERACSYFFHTADGTECHDTEGTKLASHDDAWRKAVQLLGVLVTEDPSIVSANEDFSVKVFDASGVLLFVVSVHSTTAPASRTQHAHG